MLTRRGRMARREFKAMERNDHMEKKVSAKNFCDAFAQQWCEELKKQNGPRAILHAYENDTRWTEYMLGEKEVPCAPSFLRSLAERLSLAMGREWNYLDAVYYEEQEDSYIYRPKVGGPYPDCLHVIVEHENREDVETEMWKLLMFRSPLKVLIFYDYRKDCKTTSTTDWLKEKFEQLLKMGSRVKQKCLEADNVEYIFIVGNRSADGQTLCWQYCVVERDGFDSDRANWSSMTGF